MKRTLEGEEDEECKVIARLGRVADVVEETKVRVGSWVVGKWAVHLGEGGRNVRME